MGFLNRRGKFVFTHRRVASRSDDEVKFVVLQILEEFMGHANIRNDLHSWKRLSEFGEPYGKQLRSKMVDNSQPEGAIFFWLRDPFDHFSVQIQKSTRIAKNKLSLVTEFERLDRSPEQAALQLFLKTLDLKSNSRLRDMEPL